MTNQEIEITVFDEEQYDGKWIPVNFIAAIKWLQSKLEEIPEEFRNSASIEIDSVSGYEGSHYGHVSITYTRPETDAEAILRRTTEQQRQDSIRSAELTQLMQLKAKYND